jgi:hypothetical protein
MNSNQTSDPASRATDEKELGRCAGKLCGGLQLCLTQLRPLAGRLPSSRVSRKAEVEDLGEELVAVSAVLCPLVAPCRHWCRR